MSMNTKPVRELLGKALAWHDAHASFEDAVKDIPADLRGTRPEGLPYSAWELLEHLRIAQRDILDFSVDPNYKEDKTWPDDYWPPSPAPPSDAAWEESIREFIADRNALQKLAADTSVDLEAKIPHGSGQTRLRELVLTIDHNAYHIGQLVLVRRLLGIWKT
jgi:uncharacterized damage-inducible protein DinB